MKYDVTPNSNPTITVPFIIFVGKKDYHQSLTTPGMIKNCTESRANLDAVLLKKEGWAVKIQKYDTTIGPVYIVYERRTGKEMKSPIGKKR
jgi:hypothetical protein